MSNWDDMRYFLAVARQGSVTGAAATLGVNHSTVSRRIRALESQHGVRLFERLLSGYEMTQAAENIFHHAVEMEKQVQVMERELFGQDARLQGLLTLTAPHDIANSLIIPKLGEFKEQYPDIELKMLVTTGLRDLTAREADIAVRLTPKPPESLVGRQVAKLRHGIYQANNSEPANDQTPVILWNGEEQMPEWVQQHFPNSKVSLRCDELSTMYAAVKAGLGVARMPCYFVDPKDALYRLDLPLTPSTWNVWVLSHADLRSTARVRVCREFLVDLIQEKRALFEGEHSRFL